MPVYKVDIDQSNRLENSGPTYLALVNHIAYTIKIPTKIKSMGRELLEAKHIPKKQIYPFLWAACVFLLLKNHLNRLAKEAGKIVVDDEFDGHQDIIKNALLEYIRNHYGEFPEHRIVIGSIGKNSSAHVKALRAKREKEPVNRVITKKEFWEVLP
jgi:hypothetical protein